MLHDWCIGESATGSWSTERKHKLQNWRKGTASQASPTAHWLVQTWQILQVARYLAGLALSHRFRCRRYHDRCLSTRYVRAVLEGIPRASRGENGLLSVSGASTHKKWWKHVKKALMARAVLLCLYHELENFDMVVLRHCRQGPCPSLGCTALNIRLGYCVYQV